MEVWDREGRLLELEHVDPAIFRKGQSETTLFVSTDVSEADSEASMLARKHARVLSMSTDRAC